MDRTLWIIVAIIIFIQLMPGNAYAYVDPGTGSYILQMMIAGILGVAFTIKTLFRRIFPNKSKEETSNRSEIAGVEDIADKNAADVGSVQTSINPCEKDSSDQV